MKTQLTFFLLLSASAVFGQLEVSAGFGESFDVPFQEDKVWAKAGRQHPVSLTAGFTNEKNWQFSVGVSYLSHRLDYFFETKGEQTDTYSDRTVYRGAADRYRADVQFSYFGFRFGASKIIQCKPEWLQLSLGSFLQLDQLTSYSATNIQKQEEDSTLTTYNDGTTETNYSITPWSDRPVTIFEMSPTFIALGIEVAPRFLINDFFVQPYFNASISNSPRLWHSLYKYQTDEYTKVGIPLEMTILGDQFAYGLRIGYRFPDSKKE